MKRKDSKISARQSEDQEMVQDVSPHEGGRMLCRLTQRNETLDPAWMAIWKEVRQHANADLPPPIIKKIEEAISRIEFVDKKIATLGLKDTDRVWRF